MRTSDWAWNEEGRTFFWHITERNESFFFSSHIHPFDKAHWSFWNIFHGRKTNSTGVEISALSSSWSSFARPKYVSFIHFHCVDTQTTLFLFLRGSRALMCIVCRPGRRRTHRKGERKSCHWTHHDSNMQTDSQFPDLSYVLGQRAGNDLQKKTFSVSR